MKSTLSLFLLIFFVNISILLAQSPRLYEKSNMKELIASHKIVAILPFVIVPDARKLGNNTSVEEMEAQAKKDGYEMQEFFYTRLLKKADNYTVSFQDIKVTNDILKKNYISYTKIAKYSKDELAKLLKVDAVIFTNVVVRKLAGYGDAIATSLTFGKRIATEEAEVTLLVNDQFDSEAFWIQQYTYQGHLNLSDSLVKGILRQISRQFPYEK